VGLMVALVPANPGGAGKAESTRVREVIAQRCAVCHAATPTQPGFAVAPKGVMLDTPERIRAQAAQIKLQVANRVMPIGNLTQMTENERALIADWNPEAK